MAESEVNIWNRALTTAGHRGQISDPLETSREAELCRVWYSTVRDTILKAAPWPCAGAYARLAVVDEQPAGEEWTMRPVPPGWRFAYAAPNDMLAPRYLADFSRFTRSQYAGQNLIVTDTETAVLHYTAAQPDVTLWDQALRNSVTAALAAKLCQAITGKATLAERLRNEAIEIYMSARSDSANESEDNYEALPSWIAIRGFGNSAVPVKFLWPYGDLSGVTF